LNPRSVRVALAPSSAHLELAPLVMEPRPLSLTTTPAREDQAGDVMIDGQPALARLVDNGAGHAILIIEPPDGPIDRSIGDPAEGSIGDPAGDPGDPDDPADGPVITRLLLEPAEPLPDGRGVVRREIVVDGWRFEVDVESERRAALWDRARRGREESARGGPTEVRAIIPGRVVSVSVVSGEAVMAGQELLVVEAMKMQNELRTPRDGTVARIAVTPGGTIEIGDLLLVLE
jgi:biotin carboxyl carrier protein